MADPLYSIAVHVTITINPSYTDAFLAALEPTMLAIIAEPLNTYFKVYQLAKEPGVFVFAEHWDATAEYLSDVQMKREYYKLYFAAITPMLLKAPEVETFDRMGADWVSLRKDSYPARE